MLLRKTLILFLTICGLVALVLPASAGAATGHSSAKRLFKITKTFDDSVAPLAKQKQKLTNASWQQLLVCNKDLGIDMLDITNGPLTEDQMTTLFIAEAFESTFGPAYQGPMAPALQTFETSFVNFRSPIKVFKGYAKLSANTLRVLRQDYVNSDVCPLLQTWAATSWSDATMPSVLRVQFEDIESISRHWARWGNRDFVFQAKLKKFGLTAKQILLVENPFDNIGAVD